MNLPPGFQFSQASLQDFVDCRRRFQLRYLLNVAWPALEAGAGHDQTQAQLEQRLLLGQRFHHLLHQHLAGLPVENLEAMLRRDRTPEGGELLRWWEAYRRSVPDLLGVQDLFEIPLPPGLYPELTLSAGLAGYRLLAKFDLVAIGDGESGASGGIRIVDWKTGRRPSRATRLAERLQTRVYRYLLVRAGGYLLPGGALQPEQIEMIYWFSEALGQPVRFPYSPADFRADEAYLSGLVQEIAGLPPEGFPLTLQAERCRFCVYRSLCDRGVRAGLAEEAEEELSEFPEAPFAGFDQVAEIAF